MRREIVDARHGRQRNFRDRRRRAVGKDLRDRAIRADRQAAVGAGALPLTVLAVTPKALSSCVMPDTSTLSVCPPGIATESGEPLVRSPFAAEKFRLVESNGVPVLGVVLL